MESHCAAVCHPVSTDKRARMVAQRRGLEIKCDPNGGVVTGIYFTTHPSVYTAFNESASDGW